MDDGLTSEEMIRRARDGLSKPPEMTVPDGPGEETERVRVDETPLTPPPPRPRRVVRPTYEPFAPRRSAGPRAALAGAVLVLLLGAGILAFFLAQGAGSP